MGIGAQRIPSSIIFSAPLTVFRPLSASCFYSSVSAFLLLGTLLEYSFTILTLLHPLTLSYACCQASTPPSLCGEIYMAGARFPRMSSSSRSCHMFCYGLPIAFIPYRFQKVRVDFSPACVHDPCSYILINPLIGQHGHGFEYYGTLGH